MDNQVKKISLWICFLPISAWFVMVIVMNRWRKHGLLWENKFWTRNFFVMGACIFLPQLVMLPILIPILLKTQNMFVVWLSYYLLLSVPSFFIRNAEYKELVKALQQQNK